MLCKDWNLLCFVHIYPQLFILYECIDTNLCQKICRDIQWERQRKVPEKYQCHDRSWALPWEHMGASRRRSLGDGRKCIF